MNSKKLNVSLHVCEYIKGYENDVNSAIPTRTMIENPVFVYLEASRKPQTNFRANSRNFLKIVFSKYFFQMDAFMLFVPINMEAVDLK